MTVKKERRKLIAGMVYPMLLIAVLWVVKLIEINTHFNFSSYGIIPLKAEGIIGIFTSPFIHGSLKHLISNSIPLFFLATGLFYFYDKMAFKVLLLSYLMTGVWVWLFARGNASHIGASGIVYALATFHFFSGLLRRQKQLMAFAMIIIFLYGSMVWGVFPDFYPDKPVSWEGHLMGAISGVVLAIYYRTKGLQRKKRVWLEYDEEWEERIKKLHGHYADELDNDNSSKSANTSPNKNQSNTDFTY
ncbi:MAG: rhomboid family intramembrane serine protease [Bacteroidota bacterium]|nr:rhomboid family intramembrane serine protease [Bacteroidota bacterium]